LRTALRLAVSMRRGGSRTVARQLTERIYRRYLDG
jgi:hypothetical protein